MRAHEFLLERSGLTKGDLAETFFGAAMAAAFEKYPTPVDESSMLAIAKSLTPPAMSYTARNAGKPADNIELNNVIKNVLHLDAFTAKNFNNTVETMRPAFPSILAAANGELNAHDSRISAKEILENGIADLVNISAVGGEDQSATKIDVQITHNNSEIQPIHQPYSLKYDEGGKLMPVGQNPAVAMRQGAKDQITFWKDIGVDINKNSERKALDAVNNKIKNKKYQSDKDPNLAKDRRQSDAFKDTVSHMITAADQINQLINNDVEEATFLNNLIEFLKIHVSKGDPDLKVLGITTKGGYKIGHLDYILDNVDNISLYAEVKADEGKPPKLLIWNTFEDEEAIVVEIRLKTAGGYTRPGKRYQNLRYTLTISIGPGFNRITTLNR